MHKKLSARPSKGAVRHNQRWMEATVIPPARITFAVQQETTRQTETTHKKKHPKTDIRLQQGQKTANEDNAASGKSSVQQVVKVICTSDDCGHRKTYISKRVSNFADTIKFRRSQKLRETLKRRTTMKSSTTDILRNPLIAPLHHPPTKTTLSPQPATPFRPSHGVEDVQCKQRKQLSQVPPSLGAGSKGLPSAASSPASLPS